MVKKIKRTDEGLTLNVGTIMTISLFLILLTFFIMLSSVAVIDEKKSIVAIGSLLGAFGSFQGGLSPLNTGDSTLAPSAPMIEARPDLNRLLSLLDQKILGDIKVKSSKDRSIITVNEDALFEQDKSRLKPSSYQLLDQLCSLLKKARYPVEIVGYTDNRPADEKGYNSNWEISSLMAIQVLRYFVEKGQISAQRLAAYGRGSQQPIASNDTAQSREQNRRVEIILNFDAPAYVKRIYRKKPAGIFSYKQFNFKVF
jgi:chemotaxis protein MotB